MGSRKRTLMTCSILSFLFFSTSIFAVTKDQAKTIAIANAFGNQVSSSNVMITKDLLPANSEIKCLKTTYSSPANPSWMFFADDHPGANWSHSARIAFVDQVTGDYQVINVQWPPAAGNGISLNYDTIAKNATVAPDPKGLAITPLNSQISNRVKKSFNAAGQINAVSKYAVLICGGYDAGNLHERYYTDLKEMYTTLVNTYHYPTANIYVLCADGDADGNDSIAFDGVQQYMDLDSNGTVDCNTAASKAEIVHTFQSLNTKMTSEDLLFVFTTDHGSNIVSPPGSIYDEGSLTLWDYEEMRDDEFADAVNLVTNYGYEIFCFEQCFSGDMINDLEGTNRVIATAADWDEYSWGRVFSALWISAVNGSAPAADYNNDSYISMLEAFSFADTNDLSGEDPQYYESTAGLGATLSLDGLIPTGPIPNVHHVKVQINTNGTPVTTNCPRIDFKLLNVDTSDTIDLNKIEIRYWFSAVTTQTQIIAIDNADYRLPYRSLNGRIISQMVPVSVAGQTHYMSLKFSSGAPLMPPGAANYATIQSRFNKANWSNYYQGDDWSFIQTNSFVDANNVTVYYDSVLVWGNEPSGIVIPPASFKVQYSTSNTSNITNQLYVNVRIYNTGTTAENISSLDLKYWYSKEGTQSENISKDWVGVNPSGQNITSQTQAVIETAAVAGQTNVVHLSFTGSSVTIDPNNYIEARLRVNKTNWSNYTQNNDYSFLAQSAFTDCNKICLYKNGTLVWGVAP